MPKDAAAAVFLLGLFLPAAPSHSLAQERCAPEVGIPLRFTHLDPDRRESRFMGLLDGGAEGRRYDDTALVMLAHDTLRTAIHDSVAAFPLREVEGLEMECPRDVGAGAVTGLWQGAVLGAVGGLLWAFCDPEFFFVTGEFCHYGIETSDIPAVTAKGALVGGGVGVLLGAAFGGGRWVPVPMVSSEEGGRGGSVWRLAVGFSSR